MTALSPTQNIYADLVRWGASLPLWQNEIIRRLSRQDTLSDDEIDEIASAAVNESEQQTVGYRRLAAGDFPAIAQPASGATLESVGSLRNVNALLPDQTIRFGNQLTVVYGANASGKSGYGRVLKRIFRARVRDEILHDLRSSKPPGVPAARVVVKSQGQTATTVEWVEGDDLPEVFARFSVLDGHCSRSYVDGDCELSVAPEGLDIPERTASAIDRAKGRLSERAADARVEKGALVAFESDRAAGLFIRSLSSGTPRADIDKWTTFSDGDAVTLDGLALEIDELKLKSPRVLKAELARQRANLSSLIEFLAEIKARVSDSAVAALRDAVETHDSALSAAEAVKASTLGGATQNGVGTDPWRQMILAASEFVAQTAGGEPSLAIGNECALCWQSLDRDARSRLEQFLAFLSSAAEATAAQTRAELEMAKSSMERVPKRAPNSEATLASNVSPETVDALNAVVSAAYDRASFCGLVVTSRRWDEIPIVDFGLSPELEERVAHLDVRLGGLADEATADKNLAAATRRYGDLSDRKALAGARKQIVSFVDGLTASQRFEAVAKAISTRAVSTKADELDAKYRTEDFEQRFVLELRDELRFSRNLPVFHKRTSKAKTFLTPVISEKLKNIRAPDVFSEGERTAISLAAFLAEMAIAGDTAGLIFDDPITSLDHNVRARVAERLVREAKQRQVIVFTHDLAFFADLRAEAKGQTVECQTCTLSADEFGTGFVEDEVPFAAKTVAARVKVLEKRIADLEQAGKAGNHAALHDQRGAFYGLLRATWERFVEEKMFNGAVQRLERNVRPGALLEAVVTTPIIENVQKGYKRCSEMIEGHDHALGDGQHTASTAEMRADLGLLRETIALVKTELAARAA